MFPYPRHGHKLSQTVRKCKTKKEELDPDSTGDMKEEPKLEDGESENEDVDAEGVQEEEAELRDVIYRMEKFRCTY